MWAGCVLLVNHCIVLNYAVTTTQAPVDRTTAAPSGNTNTATGPRTTPTGISYGIIGGIVVLVILVAVVLGGVWYR